MFYKYPSIEYLNHRPEILSVKEVICIEKLHGSSLRLMLPIGISSIDEIQYGSRNQEFGNGDNGSFYGGKPIEWFKKQPIMLQKMIDVFKEYNFSNVIVYGEVCSTTIQKGVIYTRPGEVIFRVYDIRVNGNFLSTRELFVEICEKIGLPYEREVWRGYPLLESFDLLLNIHSQEGIANGVDCENNIAEGVVIRSNPLLQNVFGEYLIIKHKSEKWKENASAPKTQSDNTTIADSFAETYVVQGRIINVIGHLRDTGILIENHMSDMKYLVPAMFDDIKKECEPEWNVAIYNGATENQIKKSIQKNTKIVYHRMLLENV